MRSLTLNRNTKNPAAALLALLIIGAVGLGCGLVKNPFRDRSKKAFNSAAWRAGDAVERGRMFDDLFEKRTIEAQSEDEVRRLLGEPDKKTTAEGRAVWLYRIDIGHNEARPYLPVSFEPRGGAFIGKREGGKMSLLVAD